MKPFLSYLAAAAIANIPIFIFISRILKNQKQIMATQAQFETALNRIDAATTATAEKLRELAAQIEGAGLSAEVESSVLARLETAASQLEAIGGNVENPVPEEPTEEQPTPGEPTEGSEEEAA